MNAQCTHCGAELRPDPDNEAWIDERLLDVCDPDDVEGMHEPHIEEYEVSIRNIFDAVSPEDAALQMFEWLTSHGGATQGGYSVRKNDNADGVFVDIEAIGDDWRNMPDIG